MEEMKEVNCEYEKVYSEDRVRLYDQQIKKYNLKVGNHYKVRPRYYLDSGGKHVGNKKKDMILIYMSPYYCSFMDDRKIVTTFPITELNEAFK